MKKTLGFLFIALFLIFSFSSAFAASLKIETINVAPFGFLDKDGKPTGIYYEISNLIAKEAGIPYENSLTSYARSAKAMEDGNASFVLRFTNPDLEKSSIQVAQIVAMPNIIFGVKGTVFNNLLALRGKTVGVLRGGLFDERFAADELIQKNEVNDYESMLNMLMAKRIDAALGSSIGLYYETRKLGINKNQIGQALILNSQYCFLHFSKKTADDKTVAAIKAAVERLKKQDAFTKIINKYMGDFNWSLTTANN